MRKSVVKSIFEQIKRENKIEKTKAVFSSLLYTWLWNISCLIQIKAFHRDVSNWRMNLLEEKEQCIIFIAYFPESYGLYWSQKEFCLKQQG